MNRTEQIRNEILTQCYGYRPQARDAERMARTAKHEGEIIAPRPIEFEREAAYLCGKDLIELVRDETAKAHKRFAITSKGTDHMEEQGLT